MPSTLGHGTRKWSALVVSEEGFSLKHATRLPNNEIIKRGDGTRLVKACREHIKYSIVRPEKAMLHLFQACQNDIFFLFHCPWDATVLKEEDAISKLMKTEKKDRSIQALSRTGSKFSETIEYTDGTCAECERNDLLLMEHDSDPIRTLELADAMTSVGLID